MLIEQPLLRHIVRGKKRLFYKSTSILFAARQYLRWQQQKHAAKRQDEEDKNKKNAVKLWINYCAINFSLTMALVKRVHYMLKLPINSTLPLVGGVEVAL